MERIPVTAHRLAWSIMLLAPFLASFVAGATREDQSTALYFTRDEISECTSDKVVIEKLKENYKTFRQPSANGVYVWVEVWVQEVTSINEILANFEMEIYITELWVDPAVAYAKMNPCKQNLSLSGDLFKDLWKPNTCFIDSKHAEIHKSPFENIFLMIYPNGTVWVNYRLNVIGPCNIDLTTFPMDTQTCALTMESFTYNIDEVKMRWINTSAPISFIKPIQLPDFTLISWNATRLEQQYPAGLWDELSMTFVFERRLGWYILQAYIPTYLTIFVSWISFCLGPMIPARTMLGVNSLLALTFQFGNIMSKLPRVSYVKAMVKHCYWKCDSYPRVRGIPGTVCTDVWMLACLTFIFSSLLELAIVGYLSEKVHGTRRKTSDSGTGRSNQPSNNNIAMTAVTTTLSDSDFRRFSSPPAARSGTGSTNCSIKRTSFSNFSLHRHASDQRRSSSIWSFDRTPAPHHTKSCICSTSHRHRRSRSSESDDQGELSPGSHYLLLESYYQDRRTLEKQLSTCANRARRFLSLSSWSADVIDVVSSVMFPTLFSLFNIFYWCYYLRMVIW